MITEEQATISAKFGHEGCLLCGNRNPWSLKLAFQPDEDGGVKASFQAQEGLEGYEGVLHGGVITALLDAAMTHCLFHHGVRALTGDLYVRFLHSVPSDAELELRARILKAKSPLYHLRAESLHEGRVMVWAEAKFMRQGHLEDQV